VIRGLEKIRAGLGAAGLAAIGGEVLTLHFGGSPGILIPVVAAIVCGVTAGYFADVSEREAKLLLEAGRERAASYASSR
jgi:hypothetical protein